MFGPHDPLVTSAFDDVSMPKTVQNVRLGITISKDRNTPNPMGIFQRLEKIISHFRTTIFEQTSKKKEKRKIMTRQFINEDVYFWKQKSRSVLK